MDVESTLWMRDVEELSDKVIWQPARQANNQTVAKQSNKRRLNMETLCDMSQTQSEERQENQIRTDILIQKQTFKYRQIRIDQT